MSTVAFWGPVHGQVANTSNLVAASSVLAIEKDVRVMITQTQLAHSTLESAFLKEQDEGDLLSFSDTGLDALERLARSKRLTAEKVADYTIPILHNRLELLLGSARPKNMLQDNTNSVLDTIFTVAKKHYDYCFIDVHSGTKNSMTKRVLEEADMIVVNLNQNIQLLNRFFNKEDWLEALDNKPYVIVLSQYDPKSQYSVKNIKRRYNCKQPILTVPYNTAFRDSCNDRNTIEYFLRATNFSMKRENAFFVGEIRKLVYEICNITSKLQQSENGEASHITDSLLIESATKGAS
ncbi:hypothetical protein [Metabacillus fastidiosus]|uniref:AAA domain-containing protein n=1 Tax=Metabacillus fastidiosus TaxID=1458 RepID=A0ABU6NT48_9BACI|nr:hypothetical protein [Metabacillus fastidiosus]MED4400327.1 hypothetical protein [Metabacillus fastidiosus]